MVWNWSRLDEFVANVRPHRSAWTAHSLCHCLPSGQAGFIRRCTNLWQRVLDIGRARRHTTLSEHPRRSSGCGQRALSRGLDGFLERCLSTRPRCRDRVFLTLLVLALQPSTALREIAVSLSLRSSPCAACSLPLRRRRLVWGRRAVSRLRIRQVTQNGRTRPNGNDEDRFVSHLIVTFSSSLNYSCTTVCG